MKLILDFEYLQIPKDGDPKIETIFSTAHIPNIGEKVFWRTDEDVLIYKVQDKNFTYNKGLLLSITCFLEKC